MESALEPTVGLQEVLVEDYQEAPVGLVQPPVQVEEDPQGAQVTARMMMMTMREAVRALLAVQGEAPGVSLEAGLEFLQRTGNLLPDHQEVHLATTMELFLERVGVEVEYLLELVEAELDWEDASVEALVVLQERMVLLEALPEVQEFQRAALAALIMTNSAEALVPEV